jgi:hypothetical protein
MEEGMSNPLPTGGIWCEICNKLGHDPYHCPMIQVNQLLQPPYNAPRGDIERATEVEDEQEEVLEEVEDQWYVTTFKNWDIMQENVHFHQRLVCIVVHRIMTWKNVLRY